MRQRPKYTRAKEEGRQRSGSLISTLLQATGTSLRGERDELFLVLKMLLESIHGFLHQPSALDAQHGILIHKFLDDDAGPLQQGSGLLLLLRTSNDLWP